MMSIAHGVRVYMGTTFSCRLSCMEDRCNTRARIYAVALSEDENHNGELLCRS